MIERTKWNLQLFAEGGGDAGAGDGGEAGSEAEVRPGDVLEDGTVVDARLASSMRENADRYPTHKRMANAQGQPRQGASGQQAPKDQGSEPTPEEWAEAKKRFAKFYGDDVKGAVKDRFKNQADASEKLNAMQPMLEALMKRTGAESVEELQQLIENDDSMYQEEADAAGMPVEAYKNMVKLQKEHDQLVAAAEKAEQQQKHREHFADLHRQAEELKQLFPDFDLEKEMQNEKFFRMTAPGAFSVEEAFYALHGKELGPQLMAYGVQQGKDQISRSIQANARRPVEGASMAASRSIEPHVDPKGLTDKQYDDIVNRVRRGERITF